MQYPTPAATLATAASAVATEAPATAVPVAHAPAVPTAAPALLPPPLPMLLMLVVVIWLLLLPPPLLLSSPLFLLPLLLLLTYRCHSFHHAYLCLSLLPGHACLAFVCACLGLFVPIQLLFALIWACLFSSMLIYASCCLCTKYKVSIYRMNILTFRS